MQEKRERYTSVFDRVYDWLNDATRQEVFSLMDIVEKGKGYLHAAGDLTVQELQTLENFLLRDFHTFVSSVTKDADESVWLANNRHKLWSLMSDMTDQNQLQMEEMRQDLIHNGVYEVGELVALGDLVCTQCGYVHRVEFVESIHACLECGNRRFSRVGLPPSHSD